MVTIIPTGAERCSIEICLGKNYTIHHLKQSMAQAFVLKTLKAAIYRYCRFTQEDLDKNPKCTYRWDRTSHGHAFQYSIHKMQDWDARRLFTHIVKHQVILLKMLHHPSSTSYRSLSQLAFDIIIIGNQKPWVL